MTTITLTIGALIALLIKLAAMREVRAAHLVLGRKQINISFDPPYIGEIHKHDSNVDICNNYFYSRLVISWSFVIAVGATVVALLLGLVGAGFSSAEQPDTSNSKVVSIEADLADAKWPAIVTSRDGTRMSAAEVDLNGQYLVLINDGKIRALKSVEETKSAFVLLTSSGDIQSIAGVARITQVLLFMGVISGLICWLAAGRIKALEEVEPTEGNAAAT